MVILYAAAIFLSAFLLFIVQPMIGKKILPWFGGAPAVWTTCMLFFQVALLGGYAYAHYIGSRFPVRRQIAVHLTLVVVALLFLPVYPGTWLRPDGPDHPALRILLLLAATVGIPYFILSTTSPLLQKWFLQSVPGRSPYPLYALSNAGSLLALLLYPALIEPNMPARLQAVVWSFAFASFAILLGLCAFRLWRRASDAVQPGSDGAASPAAVTTPPDPAEPPPDAYTRFLWILLAALGSMLLLAITNALCQDIAVVPFLWILPLGLYLLTFVILFENDRWYYRPLFWAAAAVCAAAMVRVMGAATDFSIPTQAVAYLATLFVFCMICHGELVRRKPAARYLTGFYLYISLGGALGAVFVTIVAPFLFSIYAELHFALWAAVAAGTAAWWHERARLRPDESFRTRLTRFSPALVLLLAFGAGLAWQARDAVRACEEVSRNFYGVLRVRVMAPEKPDIAYRALMHGSTIHGWQMLRPDLRALPTSYYHEGSGVARVLRAYPRSAAVSENGGSSRGLRVGVVGLGVGTLAFYGHKGDCFRFYEINPDVVRMARRCFTFLDNTQAEWTVVLGDARLSLEREQPQDFDILVLDAFTGDAIPMHLLTREAFDLYLRHLKPGGVIAVNTANRHLDLQPVLWAHAGHFQLSMRVVFEGRRGARQAPTLWVLLTRNDAFFSDQEFRGLTPPYSPWRVTWTDDFNDLFAVLSWHHEHRLPQWFASAAKPISVEMPALQVPAPEAKPAASPVSNAPAEPANVAPASPKTP